MTEIRRRNTGSKTYTTTEVRLAIQTLQDHSIPVLEPTDQDENNTKASPTIANNATPSTTMLLQPVPPPCSLLKIALGCQVKCFFHVINE